MYRENTHQAGKPDALIITADTPIQKAALRYLEAGFALTSVDGKRPTAKGWNSRSKAITDADQLDRLDANVGLLHAYSGTCCIDVDDFQATDGFFTDNGLNLMALLTAADSVQITSGRPNRAKLVYRTPKTLPTFKYVTDVTVVEFRCGAVGGKSHQDVLPPSIHPDTGKPYKWIGNWQKIPYLPADLLSFWLTNTVLESPRSVAIDK